MPAQGLPSSPTIRKQGQFQVQRASLARRASGLPQRPVDAALEMLIAATTLAAGCDHQLLPFLRQVTQQLAGICFDDAGTGRHRNVQ